MITTISVTEARDNLAEILNQVAYQAKRFVIKRRGEPVAVLTSFDQTKDVPMGTNPTQTAGQVNAEDTKVEIEKVFKLIKEPYGKKSLLGC